MKKERNSLFGLVFPLFIGLLASILVALSYMVFDLGYFILFVAFLIPHYMIKYLDYIKKFHYYLAAIYAIIAFLVSVYAKIFFRNFFTFSMSFGAASKISLTEIIYSLDIFMWLILIVMPIISYRYLKMKT